MGSRVDGLKNLHRTVIVVIMQKEHFDTLIDLDCGGRGHLCLALSIIFGGFPKIYNRTGIRRRKRKHEREKNKNAFSQPVNLHGQSNIPSSSSSSSSSFSSFSSFSSSSSSS